jgi:putative ABC transport system ATP-binding protein
VVLADEPTGNLDSKTGKEILELFIKLNREGTTIIVVTHDISITKYANKVIILKDGKIEKATSSKLNHRNAYKQR